MRLHAIRRFLPVFFILLLFISVFAATTSKLSFRFDTDYKTVFPGIEMAISMYKDPGTLQFWNPLMGLGVPMIGDPSNLLLSFWSMPFFLLFDADIGLRVLICTMMLLSGFCMWYFLKRIKMSDHVASWGAILYSISGSYAALVTSGRLERFASYAITPYAFALLWQKKLTTIQMIALGLVFTSMNLSLDIYTPWLISVCFVVLTGYRLIKKEVSTVDTVKTFVVVYGTFIVFSLPKILPFIFIVKPYFMRPLYSDYYQGSIQAFLMPLLYWIPLRVPFYDRPFFQRTLGFHFNWYEYFAFISPLPFIFYLRMKKMFTDRNVRYCLVLLFTGAAYLSLRYWYSPFFWFFKWFQPIQMFRVPQRIGSVMTVPVIVLACVCLNNWIKNANTRIRTMLIIIALSSIIWTAVVSFRTMSDAFEPFRQQEYTAAQRLRFTDSSKFYVLDMTCCMQPFLYEQAIPVLNYYYGWTPSYTVNLLGITEDGIDRRQLRNVKPRYIITDKEQSYADLGYYVGMTEGNIRIWQTDNPTIQPL